MRTLTLLSTEHCTLCEQTLELLLRMPQLAGWKLEVVDVAHDEGLLADYGERIPVIKCGHHELVAPITEAALVALLESA